MPEKIYCKSLPGNDGNHYKMYYHYIYNMGNRINIYSGIIKNAFKLFIKNEPLKLGGSTAFFTLFALPPVLTILVQLLSIFIDPQSIRHEMFTSLSGILGKETVRQIIEVIKAVRRLNNNWLSTILIFLFLLFVATTVFSVVKSSINQIWEVKPPADKKVLAGLKGRLLSLGVIVSTGILFCTGMLVETIQVIAGNYFTKVFPLVSGLLSQPLAFIISVSIVAVWFTIILKYLNDQHPVWRVAWAGGFLTSILFSIGKIILHLLLTYNNVNNIYGASASIVLLLLFVFYSSMILYFGAAFTKVWAGYKHGFEENKVAVSKP